MIYLDNAATTPVSPGVRQRINEALETVFGNPSSVHEQGTRAAFALNLSRQTIADSLGADSGEIIFTSGGTEANNFAIFGAIGRSKIKNLRIVTTAAEHPSVLEPVKALERSGCEVIYLKPDANGEISAGDIFGAVNDKTVLVSVMLVNNETGAVNPVKAARQAVRQKNSPAVIHCDAVAAFGKIPLNPAALGVDMLTLSAHKIHGSKGVGALYKAKSIRIKPLMYGGGQEQSLRPGTENLPFIAGFAQAVAEFGRDGYSSEHAAELNRLAKQLLTEAGGVVNSPENALPYVLNVSFPGIPSEVMLNYLSARGIYISAGSACSKGKKSHVLAAMGIAPELQNSAVRISFSKYNTTQEIEILARNIAQALVELKRV